MNRREIVSAALGLPVVWWNRSLFAQAKPLPIIGLLHQGSREAIGHRLVAFKEGLAALGWKEGANVVFEERWADGRAERLHTLAEELAAKKPAVIVTGGSPPVVAAAKAAPNIPVVMATVGDPVASGFVASLARPGGMITGLTSIAGNITDKYLELLVAIAPKLGRVGFLFDSAVTSTPLHMEAARRSSARYSIEGVFTEAGRPDDIEAAVSRLAGERVQALVIMPSTLFAAERRRILKAALAQRWPVAAQTPEYADAGALLSYGADPAASYRRAAYYVDRILKGVKPADLPVEQPTKFELVVNLKTARALGLLVPQSVLLQASRVIE